MVTVLGSTIYWFGGGAIWLYNEHKEYILIDEEDIDMSSQNYLKSGYKPRFQFAIANSCKYTTLTLVY